MRLLAPLLLLASLAAARDLTLERFDAVYDIRADCSIDVSERIRIRFTGSWNGIFREIPVLADVPGLGKWDIRLEVQGVTLAAGDDLEFKSSLSHGRRILQIWIPGASDATREIVVRYRLFNAFRNFNGLDEFYWNVTGNEWDSSIEAASATLRLPEGARGEKIRLAAFTGAYGTKSSDASINDMEPGVIRIEVNRAMGFREGLSIVVGIPEGTLQHPPLSTRLRWFVEDNWPVLLPVLWMLLFVVLWRWRGRDRLGDRTIVPRWEPPRGLAPAQLGLLIDESVDKRDLTATVVDLAVRGYLRIEETGDDHRFVKLDKDRAPLRPFERELLDKLFATSGEVAVSGLTNHFYEAIGKIESGLEESMVEEGFYTGKVSSVRGGWMALALVSALALTIVGIASGWPPLYFVLGLLCAVPATICAWNMPRRTTKGLDTLAETKGLEMYLVTAERARMREVPPDRFEKLLPYAIALDIADEWAKKFAGIYTQTPGWYVAPGGQNLFFWHGLSRMNGSLGTAMYAAPRSQSSGASGHSGFSSGGGFSGGGFGGGGGRGF